MPFFQRGDIRLHYSESGDTDGQVVLCLAPGGMNSAADRWTGSDFDPTVSLPGHRVIAMDQRNAGRSTAPISGTDRWATYADDQLALLDHLGVRRFHVLGKCIGGPYALGLVHKAPHRVQSATLFQPIGLDGNREVFYDLFDRWAAGLKGNHPEAGEDDWDQFRDHMFGGEFLFNLSPADVARCPVPILLFRGDDIYHPASTSDALAELAPRVQYVRTWRGQSALIRQTVARFLEEQALS